MKNLALFGGTGGLGKQLLPLLDEKYNVISIGSKLVDITSYKDVSWFFHGNDVDIVVNMSGLKEDFFLSDITLADMTMVESMLDVNIKGNINILSNCLPKMIKKGWGRVIGVSSIFADMNIPKNGIYSASKAFMDRLYSTANRENVQHGITCNTIQLGYWDGGMSERVDSVLQEKAKNKIPLKRFGTIEELYKTIDFIIENEYVAGSNLKLSGGL